MWVRLGSLLLLLCSARCICEEQVLVESAPPVITVGADALDFGEIPVGSTVRRKLTILNAGAEPLEVDRLAVRGADAVAFATDARRLTVERYGEVEILVRFSPGEERAYGATLEIDSNAGNKSRVRVALAGTGVSDTVCGPCDDPPPPACLTELDRVRYAPDGTCVDGACQYRAVVEACDGGCDAATTTCVGASPDASVADTAVPDTERPDAAVPDTELPDAAVLDTAVPDTAVPDAAVPDTVVSDTTVPDATVPDTAVTDTAAPDAGCQWTEPTLKLAIDFDGTADEQDIVDAMGHPLTVLGNTRNSTAVLHAGTTTGNFINTDPAREDEITSPDSPDWSLGDGDFLISAYVYPTAEIVGPLDDHQPIISQGGAKFCSCDRAWGLFLNTLLGFAFMYSVDGYNYSFVVETAQPVPLNQWTHVEVQRRATIVSIAVDGVEADSAIMEGPVAESTDLLRIGNSEPLARFWGRDGYYLSNTYLDEIRVHTASCL